jgi:enoyl-CoA hydratase/carnithine racemase
MPTGSRKLRAMPTLDNDGDVWILHLGDDENRFNPDWMTAVAELLDEVVAKPEPRALVTAAGGKIWSNGLDLDWLGQNSDRLPEFVDQVHGLFAKFLAAPVPTVAAIQGHCFAAGAMLALAHDWRVMRADRGFFCLPEVDLQIPFSVGMDSLLRAKLPIATAVEAMTTGRRYGGTDAATAGIVARAVPEDEVLAAAIEIARPLAAKAGPTLGTIKARMFAETATRLAQTEGLSLDS